MKKNSYQLPLCFGGKGDSLSCKPRQVGSQAAASELQLPDVQA